MERKSLGCYEAPKKRGLSFSIEDILKRPAERSDVVKPEGASGQGTRQATAADFGPERPPQDQPKGKCLFASSYPTLGSEAAETISGRASGRAVAAAGTSPGPGSGIKAAPLSWWSTGRQAQEHWSGLPFPSPMHESGK